MPTNFTHTSIFNYKYGTDTISVEAPSAHESRRNCTTTIEKHVYINVTFNAAIDLLQPNHPLLSEFSCKLILDEIPLNQQIYLESDNSSSDSDSDSQEEANSPSIYSNVDSYATYFAASQALTYLSMHRVRVDEKVGQQILANDSAKSLVNNTAYFIQFLRNVVNLADIANATPSGARFALTVNGFALLTQAMVTFQDVFALSQEHSDILMSKHCAEFPLPLLAFLISNPNQISGLENYSDEQFKRISQPITMDFILTRKLSIADLADFRPKRENLLNFYVYSHSLLLMKHVTSSITAFDKDCFLKNTEFAAKTCDISHNHYIRRVLKKFAAKQLPAVMALAVENPNPIHNELSRLMLNFKRLRSSNILDGLQDVMTALNIAGTNPTNRKCKRYPLTLFQSVQFERKERDYVAKLIDVFSIADTVPTQTRRNSMRRLST